MRLLSRRNRYVVEWDGIVTKFGCPHDILSGKQNVRELKRWKQVQTRPSQKLFVPVLDAAPDGSWLQMPFVKQASRIGTSVMTMRNLLEEHGEDEYDIHSGNIGVYENQMCMLDYGFILNMRRQWIANGRKFCGACLYCQVTCRLADEWEGSY